MSKPRLRNAAPFAALALPGLLAAAAAVPGAAADTVLGKSELGKLAKGIAAFFEARDEGHGTGDALAELVDEIAKIERKGGKDRPPVLALVDDLTAAIEQATPPDARPTPGKVLEEEFAGWGGHDVEYAVRAPRSYSKSKGGYPVLLCLPDAKEKPKEHIDEWWTNDALQDAVIIVAVGMPENVAIWAENGTEEEPGGRAIALQVLRQVSETFATDKGRVCLAGRGAGVAAAAKIAAASPHTFSGLLGRGGDIEPVPVANFRDLPTLFAGGGANCTGFGEQAKQLGLENCTLQPDADEAAIAAWVVERNRDDYPAHVSFEPTTSYSRSAYWLEIEGFELGSGVQIDAVLDRETNTVRIDASGITSVWLSFNDTMLDLGQPVNVVCNGVANQDLVPRNLRTMLEQAYNSGDPRRIVTARKKYDLPAAE